MVDYRKEYGCNKKGADRMKFLEKENLRLASLVPAEPTPANEFEMQIAGWSLLFDRDSCKIVKQQ